MITRTACCISGVLDPYWNLALEQTLLETVPKECCVLYLWQNANTVVIGRNQNAWKECRTVLLEEEGGKLARRLSGGGAVYHDLGNLNFTFLMPSAEYDLEKQFSVISQACGNLGIRTELSGRNDLIADGRKFSGNAFYHHDGRSFHHGTILISADREKMGRYLMPPPAKLRSKGVDSVPARVVNLSKLREGLTVGEMRSAMLDAFQQVYGCRAERIDPEAADPERIGVLSERNRSYEWNYGRSMPFNAALEDRFAWGDIRMEFDVSEGRIRNMTVYSDAMDAAIAPLLTDALTGKRFSGGDLCAAVRGTDILFREDLCTLLGTI